MILRHSCTLFCSHCSNGVAWAGCLSLSCSVFLRVGYVLGRDVCHSPILSCSLHKVDAFKVHGSSGRVSFSLSPFGAQGTITLHVLKACFSSLNVPSSAS